MQTFVRSGHNSVHEAAGLKSLDIPSLFGIVGLVLHQFDTTYEQNGFTESKELSVWDSSFFRILFMKKFQAKHSFPSYRDKMLSHWLIFAGQCLLFAIIKATRLTPNFRSLLYFVKNSKRLDTFCSNKPLAVFSIRQDEFTFPFFYSSSKNVLLWVSNLEHQKPLRDCHLVDMCYH